MHADVTATAPAELLSDYQPGAFFLSSSAGPMLADEPSAVHTSIDAATQALTSGGVLAGAVPFDRAAPARLGLYASVRQTQPWHLTTPTVTDAERAHYTWVDDGQDVYRTGVRAALERIGSTDLRKVVLARKLELNADRPVSTVTLLERLIARDPYGYTFATDVGTGTLVGASPE